MSRGPLAAAGLVAAAVAAIVVQGLLLGECLQDDAYISLRYARNLAEGAGLVFNVGERVEGYTNFSWTVLHAVPFLLGLDASAFMRIAGLLSGAAAVFGAARLAWCAYPARPLAPAIAAVLTGSLPFLAAEAAMGLETAAFAAVVCFALARYVREAAAPGRPTLSGGLLAMAALTRPEGMLVAGLCGLFDLGALRRDPRGTLRSFAVRWSSFALPVGAHVAFRVAYYGDIVPNTFRAKVGGGWATVLRGTEYAGGFALVTLPLLAAGAVGLWFTLRDRTGARVIPAVAISYAAYVIAVGGDYKPSFRFFVVPAVLLAVMAAGALASGVLRPAVAALLVAGICAWTLVAGGDARTFARWRAEQLTVHRAAGQWLGAHADPADWLATGNAGVIPYYSKLPTIDMYGLNDRHIAMQPVESMGEGPAGHEKGDGAYVLGRDPRYVLFQFARFTPRPITILEAGEVRMSRSERQIWETPGFRERYRLRSERLPGFYFNVFERIPG